MSYPYRTTIKTYGRQCERCYCLLDPGEGRFCEECLEEMEIESQKLREPGYLEMGTGLFVPEEEAFDYAMKKIPLDEDLKQELVEWFYSGNWKKED